MSISPFRHTLRHLTRIIRTNPSPTVSILRTRPTTFSYDSSFHTSSAKMTVKEIKTKDEYEELIKSNDIVLVDCTASWCGPCRMISPVFDTLSDAEGNAEIVFAKFDVDEVPELAQALGIRAMPTFKAIKGGEIVDEMLGANPQGLNTLISKVKA